MFSTAEEVKNCLKVSFTPRTRQWSVISFPGPSRITYEAKGPSATHPTKLLGVKNLLVPSGSSGSVYVPGTPVPPKPVSGSKIGDSSKLYEQRWSVSISYLFENKGATYGCDPSASSDQFQYLCFEPLNHPFVSDSKRTDVPPYSHTQFVVYLRRCVGSVYAKEEIDPMKKKPY